MTERTSICTYLSTNIGRLLLFVQVGFDSFFFGRIDYQDKAKRKNEKSLEVVWKGSKSLGSSAQVKSERYFFFFFFLGAGFLPSSFTICTQVNNNARGSSFDLLLLVLFLSCLCIVSEFLLVSFLIVQIFTGVFPQNYEPPPGGFYYEVNDDSPIVQVKMMKKLLYLPSAF